MILYRNIKTGNIYIHMGATINTTNAQDGQIMTQYRPLGSVAGVVPYVRESKEFEEKFVLMGSADEEKTPC